VAQDQRVEFLFAAQVTGQNEMQKLIASVDALRKETDQLKTANAGLASSTDSVIRNGVRYNNALDAQSKSLRQNRQGTQQLGMQINDFATSVSTGASPVQAFNQQIGQVGIAMSMMGGIAGKVGAFLAGPFGAAIVIGTMVLAPFIESLFNTGEAAKKAAEETEKLEKREKALAEIASDLVVARARIDQAMGKNVDSFLVAQQEVVKLARMDIESANQSIDAAKKRLEAARANILANKTMQTMGTGLRAPGISILATMREYFQDNEANIKKDKDALGEIEVSMRKLEVRLTNSRGDALERANDIADRSAREGLAAAKRAAAEAARIAKKAEAERDKEEKGLEDFFKLIEQGNRKELPEFQRQILAIEDAFSKLTATQQASDKNRFAKIFEQLRLDAKGAQIEVSDYLKKPMEDLPISKEMTEIMTQADEMRQSFDAVGSAIANSFKGMLTGAMSFKSAMQGIIGAVIDELFRLYVVKQIVGIVTSAVGLPPARARGGPVTGNQPYMVGERGPELFVPNGNGTIIPNQNVRGSGGGSSFNINVDARGSNDPAAVRAQVQQGILEAAPAIIAAAESRTIAGLRRPRLGGVMQ
jgi:hypothetical protein